MDLSATPSRGPPILEPMTDSLHRPTLAPYFRCSVGATRASTTWASKRVLTGVLMTCILAIPACTTNQSEQDQSTPTGFLYLTSPGHLSQTDEPSDLDLWRLDLETEELTQLTDGPGDDGLASLSPDGRSIAYTEGDAGMRVAVGPTDGSEIEVVGFANTAAPSWSPDCSSLAVVGKRPEDAHFSLWILDLDGQAPQQITDQVDGQPDWALNGEIIFTRFPSSELANETSLDPGADIYAIDAKTGDTRQITDNEVADVFPSVSSDGDRLAWIREVDGIAQLFVAGLDGADARQLTFESTNVGVATWSPDDDWIAVSIEDKLAVVRVDDGKVVRYDHKGRPDEWGPNQNNCASTDSAATPEVPQ